MTPESWGLFWTAFWANLPAAIAAIATLFVAVRSRRDVRTLHMQINSRLSEWIKNAQSSSRAEGVAQGIEDERARRHVIRSGKDRRAQS